jgi:hypothetical protein
MHYFLLYFVTTPLHVPGSYLTRHQEAKCITRLSAGLGENFLLTQARRQSLQIVKEVPVPHYTLRLLMMG